MIKIEDTTLIDALNIKVASIFTAAEVPRIYIGTVPSGFTRPCISLLEIDLNGVDTHISDDYRLQDRYAMYDIIYYPSSPEYIYEEFRMISNRIQSELTDITISTGTKSKVIDRFQHPKCTVESAVGHCIVNFFYRVAITDTTPVTTISAFDTTTRAR